MHKLRNRPDSRYYHTADIILRIGHQGSMNSKKLYISWNSFSQVDDSSDLLMVVFGGRGSDGEALGDLWVLDLDSQVWESRYSRGLSNVAIGPEARYAHASFVHEGRLYIHGGISGNGDVLRDLWCFDFETNTWELIHAGGKQIGVHHDVIPPARAFHSIQKFSRTVLVLGGIDHHEQIHGDEWLFSLRENQWIPGRGVNIEESAAIGTGDSQMDVPDSKIAKFLQPFLNLYSFERQALVKVDDPTEQTLTAILLGGMGRTAQNEITYLDQQLFLSVRVCNDKIDHSYGCVECELGTYASFDSPSQAEDSNVVHFSTVKCMKCAKGTFSSSYGSTHCSECPKGTYGLTIGAKSVEECDLCEIGTYNPHPGASKCEVCPENTLCPIGSQRPLPIENYDWVSAGVVHVKNVPQGSNLPAMKDEDRSQTSTSSHISNFASTFAIFSIVIVILSMLIGLAIMPKKTLSFLRSISMIPVIGHVQSPVQLTLGGCASTTYLIVMISCFVSLFYQFAFDNVVTEGSLHPSFLRSSDVPGHFAVSVQLGSPQQTCTSVSNEQGFNQFISDMVSDPIEESNWLPLYQEIQSGSAVIVNCSSDVLMEDFGFTGNKGVFCVKSSKQKSNEPVSLSRKIRTTDRSQAEKRNFEKLASSTSVGRESKAEKQLAGFSSDLKDPPNLETDCTVLWLCKDCYTEKLTAHVTTTFIGSLIYAQFVNWTSGGKWTGLPIPGYSRSSSVILPSTGSVFRGHKPTIISQSLVPVYFSNQIDNTEGTGYRLQYLSSQPGDETGPHGFRTNNNSVSFQIQFVVSDMDFILHVRRNLQVITFVAGLMGIAAGSAFLARVFVHYGEWLLAKMVSSPFFKERSLRFRHLIALASHPPGYEVTDESYNFPTEEEVMNDHIPPAFTQLDNSNEPQIYRTNSPNKTRNKEIIEMADLRE